MVLWPIFFVAASHQSPHLKPRNFKKTVAKGIGGIRIGNRQGSTREELEAEVNDCTMPEEPHWAHKEQVCVRLVLVRQSKHSSVVGFPGALRKGKGCRSWVHSWCVRFVPTECGSLVQQP